MKRKDDKDDGGIPFTKETTPSNIEELQGGAKQNLIVMDAKGDNVGRHHTSTQAGSLVEKHKQQCKDIQELRIAKLI